MRLLPPPVIVLLAVATSSPNPAVAAVRRLVEVSYEREYDRSEGVVREVTFVTGRELNKKTKSYAFSTFSNYALIWFDQDNVAIVELQATLFGVGEEFDGEDFRKAFRFLAEIDGTQSNSRSQRRWYFTAKRFLKWIDPRAEE